MTDLIAIDEWAGLLAEDMVDFSNDARNFYIEIRVRRFVCDRYEPLSDDKKDEKRLYLKNIILEKLQALEVNHVH